MDTFSITLFKSVKAGINGRTEEMTWQQFVEDFDEHQIADKKEGVALFNGTLFQEVGDVLKRSERDCFENPITGEYAVRRLKQNAIQVELLILDYDGTLTIKDAKERFRPYRYLGYTSHGHLKKSGVEKFRLIFPLTQPIPAHYTVDEHDCFVDQGAYYELTEAILEFAPGCDPAVLRPTQPYYIPSAPSDRLQLAERWQNEGQVLDWTKWEQDDRHVRVDYPAGAPRKSDGQPNRDLSPEQEFIVKRMVIKAKDIKNRVQYVTCPFHGDGKGSEFLMRYPNSGVVCFHCKRCGTFSLRPEPVEYSIDTGLLDDASSDVFDLLGIDQSLPWDNADRLRVNRFLDKTKQAIMADRGLDHKGNSGVQFSSNILYLPEGAGKSQLAFKFVSDRPHYYFRNSSQRYRNQIIFACKSWKQVIEQHKSFEKKLREIGRVARIAWSFEGLIYNRFKVKVKRAPASAFETGDILEKESIAEISKHHPDLSEALIRTTWEVLKGDAVRFEHLTVPDIVSHGMQSGSAADDGYFQLDEPPPIAMVFTTFAQLRIFAAKRDNIPLNWIIWIDDPDIDEFLDIKRAPCEADSDDEDTVIINGTTYYERPPHTSLGLAFARHRSIFTTTEELTVRFLEKKFKERGESYVKYGKRHAVTGGKISIFGTRIVQKKYDGIVPLLARQLGTTLIADGIPAEFNHSTNKGRNDLSKHNLLVEVSQPHPFQVKTVCDALGLDFQASRHEITDDILLDRMHQAIGRNSGYRSNGFECVVLVDKNKHQVLTKKCGYVYDQVNSVQIDRLNTMGSGETRLTGSASALAADTERFINSFHHYATDMRRIKPDITYVLNQIGNKEKRLLYVERLLVALTSFSGVGFDLSLDQIATNSTSQIYWKLGSWIINECIDDADRVMVMNGYKKSMQ